MVGVDTALTVKPLTIVATSTPVVNVALRRPVAAPPAMVMFAVSVVELATTQLFTVMFEPKLQTVVELTKFVFDPTTAIERLVSP